MKFFWSLEVGTWSFLLLVGLPSTLNSQPGSPNRVLELHGEGDYLELPGNIFNELTEATVEGWVKWERWGNWARFFDFGKMDQAMNVTQQGRSNDLEVELAAPEQSRTLRVASLLRLNQWCHLALTTSPDGAKV